METLLLACSGTITSEFEKGNTHTHGHTLKKGIIGEGINTKASIPRRVWDQQSFLGQSVPESLWELLKNRFLRAPPTNIESEGGTWKSTLSLRLE